MSISADIWSQLLALPPSERFSLAQKLLDSIDDVEAGKFDEHFIADVRQRREEMLHGESIELDWRSALSQIESTLNSPS